jgi:hypothetical protein
MQTGAQRFADRLFGSETTSQARDLASTLANFHFGEDTLEKTFAVVRVDLAHAIDLDNIDTDRDIDAPRCVQGRGQTRQARWPEKPVGNSFPGLAHERCKQDWRVFVHLFALNLSD